MKLMLDFVKRYKCTWKISELFSKSSHRR